MVFFKLLKTARETAMINVEKIEPFNLLNCKF